MWVIVHVTVINRKLLRAHDVFENREHRIDISANGMRKCRPGKRKWPYTLMPGT